MCIAHSTEAGDPVPHSVAKICTVGDGGGGGGAKYY